MPKIKMETEIPVCKRCCFCLPLRYGLLMWGYFKIIAYLFLILVMVYYLVIIILLMSMFAGMHNAIQMANTIEFILAIITLMTLVMDLVATIFFIVAGHKKSVKLLRIFYFYSIAMFIVTALLATTIVCLLIGYWISNNAARLDPMLVTCSTYFVVLVQQTYFLLLLRSEIMKLRIVGDFKFVNNAAEAECTMKCPEIDEREENEIEVV